MTTWESIVGLDDERVGHERACVFCGAFHIGKLVYTENYVSELRAYARQQMARVTLNLCTEAMKYVDEDEASTVHVCCACDHWMRKRKTNSRYMSAYDAMLDFFRMFTGEEKKTFDLRILKRLCIGLHTESHGRKNYYSTVLTPFYHDLTMRISQAADTDINHILTRQHFLLNGASLFSVDRRAAERLRECLAEIQSISTPY